VTSKLLATCYNKESLYYSFPSWTDRWGICGIQCSLPRSKDGLNGKYFIVNRTVFLHGWCVKFTRPKQLLIVIKYIVVLVCQNMTTLSSNLPKCDLLKFLCHQNDRNENIVMYAFIALPKPFNKGKNMMTYFTTLLDNSCLSILIIAASQYLSTV